MAEELKSHEEVDEAILSLIVEGRTNFTEILGGIYSPLLDVGGYRHVDRRIQALRKKGLIQYTKKAWALAQKGES